MNCTIEFINDSSVNDTTRMLNETLLADENAIKFYEYLYGDTQGKIVLYLNLLLGHAVGPLLALGIVFFECCGGDPQKRTIVNRLLSLFLGNFAIYCAMAGIIRIIRDLHGLLDYNLMVWVTLVGRCMKVSGILFYDQLTITRFLYIVVWKRIREINDPLLIWILGLTTYATASALLVCVFLVGHNPNYGLLIVLASEKDIPQSSSSRYLPAMMYALSGYL